MGKKRKLANEEKAPIPEKVKVEVKKIKKPPKNQGSGEEEK